METITTAKLFTHGGSQAVRLPKAFRFSGDQVRIRRDGDRVILEPIEIDWPAFWTRLDGNKVGGEADDWAEIDDLPCRDVTGFDE